MKLVAVTSCPTGIAHTFMAAESLENAAEEKGIEIKVETRSVDGVENELTEQDIEAATGVIIAADKKIQTARFSGKAILNVAVGEAMQDAGELIDEIIKKADNFDSDEQELVDEAQSHKAERSSQQTGLYKQLLNGISKIIPSSILKDFKDFFK